MSQKFWQRRKMATADSVMDEIRGHLRSVAGRDHKTVERAIECAARALDIPFSRAWSIWYGKARQILAHEADNIRARAQVARQREIERTRANLARLEAEYDALTRELESKGSSDVGGDPHPGRSPQALDSEGLEPHRRVGGRR